MTDAKDVWTNETNQGTKLSGRWKARRVGWTHTWERPGEGKELRPEKVGRWKVGRVEWRESEGNRRAQRGKEEVHGEIEGSVSRVDAYVGARRRRKRIEA